MRCAAYGAPSRKNRGSLRAETRSAGYLPYSALPEPPCPADPLRLANPALHGLLLVCLVPAAALAAVPFQRQPLDAGTPFAATANALADLDGDGLADAVVADGGNVLWYPASDGVGRTLLAGGAGAASEGLAAGDLDGDGDLDLALANGIWLEHPGPAGDPLGDPWPEHGYGTGPGQGVALADLDADSDLDIARRDAGGLLIQLYLQGPGGAFSEVAAISAPPGRGFALAWIDGDTAIDIALGDRWLANPGNPAGAWSEFLYGASPASETDFRVATGDVDGDGRLDVVTAPEQGPGATGRILWQRAPADPRAELFEETEIVAATEAVHRSLEVGDFDADGDLDVLTARTGEGVLAAYPPEITLLRNRGSGITWDAEVVAPVAAYQVRAGDRDADGDLDLFGTDGVAVDAWSNLGATRSHAIWKRLSTATGDLELPSLGGNQQTAALIFDVDLDGRLDLVITERTASPSVVWYHRQPPGWERHVIDPEILPIEAGGHFYDIDGDGDLDFAMGGDSDSNQCWWWENPLPDGDVFGTWNRYLIKDGGAFQHHDMRFDDIDGDGQVELVYWNQGAGIFVAEIPADPKAGPWPATLIYNATERSEGLATADVDGNGIVDIVAAGRWFEYTGPGSFVEHVVDPTMAFTRAAAGQLVAGGWQELVFVIGDSKPSAGIDGKGPLRWYEWDGSQWVGHDLLPFDTDHGHSLDVADLNQDGHLDIWNAEMNLLGNVDAANRVFYGDSLGHFTLQEVSLGVGNHESKLGDLDGDGDLDILGKPFKTEAPGLNIWINERIDPGVLPIDRWTRHSVDPDMPWLAVQVNAADIDGDGRNDMISGGWWYPSPGNDYSQPWERRLIGSPLNNAALVYDFDGDGDPDILGTSGQSQQPTHPGSVQLYWARNDGAGNFTILNNITPGNTTNEADAFVQGITPPTRFTPGGPLQIAISWNFGEFDQSGVDMLTLPDDPVNEVWPLQTIHPFSEGEELQPADLDGDGDIDLFQGSGWLRNENPGWTRFDVTTLIGNNEPYDDADRVSLADLDGDGDLDAAVGLLYQSSRIPTDIVWLEHPVDPTSEWPLHVVGTGIGGGFAMSIADFDNDGDPDITVGEHALQRRLLIFENSGDASSFIQRVIDPGGSEIDHHDGAIAFDFDGDGDQDILSLGWRTQTLWLFENDALNLLELIDTEPPTAPTSLQASAYSSSRVDLSWQRSFDNVDVGGYEIYRDGALAGSSTELAFSDTGLVEQTPYSYTVVGRDLQGNPSPPSAPTVITTPVAETIAPTLPLPVWIVALPTRTRVKWNPAWDNVGVVGYRVYRDGALIGTAWGATASEFVDEGVVPDTDYEYAVSAFDAEGNESDPLLTAQSVTSAPAPTGLWAAFGFDGTGTTALDSSGNLNHGELENGALRSPQGRFGDAIDFGGSSGDVDLGGLDVYTPGMTLMLWLYADDFKTDDARLVSKSTSSAEQDHVWMLSTIAGPHLRFRLRTNGVTTTLIGNAGTLSPGTWTHAAVTYDGTEMRIYQDGSLVGSAPKTGAIAVDPTVDAWIGANPGQIRQVFDGRIDEVKIFGRALSEAEIQSEMNQAIVEPTAPSVPGLSPLGIGLVCAGILGAASARTRRASVGVRRRQ